MQSDSILYSSQNKNSAIKHKLKPIFITIASVLFVALLLMYILEIKVTPRSIATYVDRVDVIEGYFVAVSEATFTANMEAGEKKISMSLQRLPEDQCTCLMHRAEARDIKVYKRVGIFSREIEADRYRVMSNNDEEYGWIYVLPTMSGKTHYYFIRTVTFGMPTYFWEQAFSISYNGTPLEVDNNTHFVSDIDFTKDGTVIDVFGVPCTLKPVE